MPFTASVPNRDPSVQFDVAFDVIEGYLQFFLGLPSLIAMGATVNHKYFKIALTINGKYNRLQLIKVNDHMCLSFDSNVVNNNGGTGVAVIRGTQVLNSTRPAADPGDRQTARTIPSAAHA